MTGWQRRQIAHRAETLLALRSIFSSWVRPGSATRKRDRPTAPSVAVPGVGTMAPAAVVVRLASWWARSRGILAARLLTSGDLAARHLVHGPFWFLDRR
jgi:hypothetical protein